MTNKTYTNAAKCLKCGDVIFEEKVLKIDYLLSEEEQDVLRDLLGRIRDDVRNNLLAAEESNKSVIRSYHQELAKKGNRDQVILHKLFLKLDMHSIGEIQDLMEEK